MHIFTYFNVPINGIFFLSIHARFILKKTFSSISNDQQEFNNFFARYQLIIQFEYIIFQLLNYPTECIYETSITKIKVFSHGKIYPSIHLSA